MKKMIPNKKHQSIGQAAHEGQSENYPAKMWSANTAF
jgi:hypothetical protein